MGYGDIMKVDTSGASKKTARQDGLSYDGVKASNTMAQTDLGRMNTYKAIIQKVGGQKGIDPAIIAGIISRESRAGNVLDDGWGDHGNAWGLMQVDKRYHTPKGGWNSEEHLLQGTDILTGFINEIKKKFPSWTAEQQLKGGIAAYNIGVKGVQTYERMDVGTTGDDYSSDVVARAQWYKRQGGFYLPPHNIILLVCEGGKRGAKPLNVNGESVQENESNRASNKSIKGERKLAGLTLNEADQLENTHPDTGGHTLTETMGYGDIMRVDTSGASRETANQDNLPCAGVPASNNMAETDVGRMNKYKGVIQRVGGQMGIEPAIIAGIISRESRAGNALNNGWGDNGNAWGLMQVDKRWHDLKGDWDSEKHLRQGTAILIDMINEIKKKFPRWTAEQQLKGGLAAYNKGPGSVESYEAVDKNTTGRDYSNDVTARAQWYKSQGGF
ncbi:uncharacterized protein LOC144020310 [Festucalex cinctus]